MPFASFIFVTLQKDLFLGRSTFCLLEFNLISDTNVGPEGCNPLVYVIHFLGYLRNQVPDESTRIVD